MHRMNRAAAIVGLTAILATGLAPTAIAVAQAASTSTPSGGSTTDPAEDSDPTTGLDMPASDVPQQQVPAPEPPAHDMEGMDMPAQDMPAESDGHDGTVSRPRGLVLGTFAAVNAAVLLAAALLRRRTKAEPDRRRAARLAAPATA